MNLNLWMQKLVSLYGPHTVYGPYIVIIQGRKRRTLMLRFNDGTCLQKQYGKFKMEVKLGRKLSRQDTVNHKDGNPLNDDYSNLEIISLRKNIQHAHRTGLMSNAYEMHRQRLKGHKQSTGEKNSNSHFTDNQVLEYRKQAAILDGRERRKLVRTVAANHGCSERSVRNLLTGVTYQHLADALPASHRSGRPPIADNLRGEIQSMLNRRLPLSLIVKRLNAKYKLDVSWIYALIRQVKAAA